MSQSINSTDFLQKIGRLRPKLNIKLLIRFLKYGSNYCDRPHMVHLGVQVNPDVQKWIEINNYDRYVTIECT